MEEKNILSQVYTPEKPVVLTKEANEDTLEMFNKTYNQ
jgi:hypothetical protein